MTGLPTLSKAERSILLTGCSSGIGYHCAHALKARGWSVFAACRRQEDCDRLAAEGLATVRLDYTDPATIREAVDRVLGVTGGLLDAVFNNGAYTHPGAMEDLDTDHLRALFEANFFGWYDLTRRVVPVMRSQGHGRIVNCSSVLGFVGLRFSSAYVAAKFAVEGWSDVLRLELKDAGIKVVVIEPGPIRSRIMENARARFLATIDVERSPFRAAYERELARLASGNRSSRFKLGPEAVFSKLVLALESPSPSPRYRVTIPTHVSAWLKRILPTGMLDRILLRQR